MDFKNSLEYRTYKYTQYNNIWSKSYVYSKYGILRKCLPKILFNGNTILSSFLQLIDLRIVMTLKYIDKLKHFKHITWY